MTPQRRGLLATALAVGAALVVGLGVALAVGMSAKPDQGFRDNGAGTQTPINVSGDLSDGGSCTGTCTPIAFWDLPNENPAPAEIPDPAYQISVPPGEQVASDGTFNFNVSVPLFDHANNPVRPGPHRITVCANYSFEGPPFYLCQSDSFQVLKGVATLSKTSGRQGDLLTVTGSGWVPGSGRYSADSVRITWAPAGADIDVSLEDSNSSAWSRTFNVPSLPAGAYKIRICNIGSVSDCAAADTVTKSFSILAPILTLSQSSGLTGEQFNTTGQTFLASQPYKVWFGPVGGDAGDPGVHEIGPPGGTTSSAGAFGPINYSPSEGPGNYTVTACTVGRGGTCNPNDVVQKPYTILAPTPSPTPTASPTKAPSPTPSPSPTPNPTASPSPAPSAAPSESPSLSPSPSITPSPTPSPAPTVAPVSAPPTEAPSAPPTAPPTAAPTPAPTPTAKPVIPWPEHLRSPGQTASGGGLDLGTLGGMSLLALLIAFLVPFPGTLFNKTVEANHTEIMGWIAGLKRRWTSLVDAVALGPLGPVRTWLAGLLTGRLGVLVFLGLSALVYSFLSPTFGFDTNSVALFLGLLLGLAFITAAFDLPLRIYHGRTSKAHDRGVLRALWWTLLVAVICVVVSRLANFQPGYLYGLVVSIVFVSEISRRDEGLGVWLASFWLIILSFVAWILLAFVRQGSFDPWVSLFVQTMLVTFVVAGIETLVIGLLPMRFLPGHPLYQWKRGAWFVLFALSVMGYLLILVDPANGYLSDDSRTPMLVGVIFLVTFGIVSVGTWAYFRFRPARPDGDRPGETASA